MAEDEKNTEAKAPEPAPQRTRSRQAGEVVSYDTPQTIRVTNAAGAYWELPSDGYTFSPDGGLSVMLDKAVVREFPHGTWAAVGCVSGGSPQ